MTNDEGNSKLEIRNSKQIRIGKSNSELSGNVGRRTNLRVLLGISDFEFVSDFGFRISTFIRASSFVIRVFIVLLLMGLETEGAEGFNILKPEAFRHHIERFNSMEPENVTNLVSN